jgi:uncharacterized protein (TIGR03905 family)
MLKEQNDRYFVLLEYKVETMKKLILAIVSVMVALTASAQEKTQNQTMEQVVVDDYKIISDKVEDGVRYIVAAPSAKVCSKQIDIQIKDGIIQSVVYTRGCEGNAKGIGALIKDMTVEEAIRRLDGITCGKRGTSCPDQLAKVLKALE